MWVYILRRAALGLPTLFVISVISFAIIQLPPGDFVSTALLELAESGTETELHDPSPQIEFARVGSIWRRVLHATNGVA